jgi:hypothetical protein
MLRRVLPACACRSCRTLGRNVPSGRSPKTIYLAAILGGLFPFLLLALVPYADLLVSPMVEVVGGIGVTEHATFNMIDQGFWPVLWAVVSGLIFGLPLGLVARSQWGRAWVVFVTASIGATLCALAWNYDFPGIYELPDFLLEWSLVPVVWGVLFGVGLFMWLGSRLRARLWRQNQVAP